ncbi:MAG: hypothetical protein CMM08_17775 [Rhodospirillaceae bacterium]|nr:hypothetical protein [Rhodospirillaceae bacterium]
MCSDLNAFVQAWFQDLKRFADDFGEVNSAGLQELVMCVGKQSVGDRRTLLGCLQCLQRRAANLLAAIRLVGSILQNKMQIGDDHLQQIVELVGDATGELTQRLDLFESGSFALVLTDIALPGGMDGREIARLVRAKNPNLPFVFISGYAEEIELMARNLRPGDQLLAKPFDPDVLEAMISQALAGQHVETN